MVHQAASGTGVMMDNRKIMQITRHNSMDYSKSKMQLRPRWEVEVSEGVDLLLVSFPFRLIRSCGLPTGVGPIDRIY